MPCKKIIALFVIPGMITFFLLNSPSIAHVAISSGFMMDILVSHLAFLFCTVIVGLELMPPGQSTVTEIFFFCNSIFNDLLKWYI